MITYQVRIDRVLQVANAGVANGGEGDTAHEHQRHGEHQQIALDLVLCASRQP
jgi:hypothetical protein